MADPNFTPESPRDDPTTIDERVELDRVALEPARLSLVGAGYYAYGMLDDKHRWTIAVDDEDGGADIRIGGDGFEVELRTSSPGLYADEDNEWQRRTRSRLARMTIPNIARGFLEPHQRAEWDEVEEGVAVSETWQLPFTRASDIGPFVRQHLPALEHLLARIESQLG